MTTILLVEPDAKHRQSLKNILKGSDYTICGETESEKEVLTLFARTRPDILLLSVVLPKVGGISLIEMIRDVEPHAKIMVTYEWKNSYLVMKALDTGAIGQIRKPFTKEHVMEKLARAEKVVKDDKFHDRRAERLKKNLIIRFKGKDEGILARRKMGVTIDISSYGVGIKTGLSYPANTLLSLEIELSQNEIIKATGNVQHVKEVVKDKTYNLGIAFTEITEQDQEKLNQFILEKIVSEAKFEKINRNVIVRFKKHGEQLPKNKMGITNVIGTTGMKLKVGECYEKDTILNILIEMPDGQMPLEVSAKITKVAQFKESTNYGLDLAYINLDIFDQQRLEDFIEQYKST